MKCVLTIFILFITTFTAARTDVIPDSILSGSSRISLLTAAPGEELYSAFGHTGIRVTDYKNNLDVVFNYGTFDFGQPGFYTNFVKGKMLYMLSVSSFDNFMKEYVYDQRSVSEQVLHLGFTDKQKIFSFLHNNALPENREYFYDFFWDNCATRPRDVFENVLGNRIQYHTDNASFEKNKTMHDMLRIYVGNRPWIDYGFDLILGLPCEMIASPRDQTFLPDYLAKYIACASIDGKPLVSNTELLLLFPLPEINTAFRPVLLSIILVFIALTVWIIEQKRKTHFYTFDFALFLPMGLLGTFFLSLWIFTSHYSVPENLNLLWLLPSHAVVAFLLLKKKKTLWLRFYFTGTCILMILLLIGWQWLPQRYNMAVMPLLLLLAFRSASVALHLKSVRGSKY
jgi:hypothetical protein